MAIQTQQPATYDQAMFALIRLRLERDMALAHLRQAQMMHVGISGMTAEEWLFQTRNLLNQTRT